MQQTPTSQSGAYRLRALAALLNYPSAEVQQGLPEITQALCEDAAWPKALQPELHGLLLLLQQEQLLDWQMRYSDAFEQSRATSLHIFEHVHGHSRDRGAAMIDLQQSYEQQGMVLHSAELPDYLPVVLEFASLQSAAHARAFLSETAHIVQNIGAALHRQQSPFTPLISAVLVCAGHKPLAAVPVAAWWRAATMQTPGVSAAELAELDAQWAAPAAFDGCSDPAQHGPAAHEQPLRFVQQAAFSSKTHGVGASL